MNSRYKIESESRHKKNCRKSAKQGRKWKFITIALFLVSGWCYPDWIKEQYTDLLDLIQFVHILHGILEPVLIPIGAFFCSILETMQYGDSLSVCKVCGFFERTFWEVNHETFTKLIHRST